MDMPSLDMWTQSSREETHETLQPTITTHSP